MVKGTSARVSAMDSSSVSGTRWVWCSVSATYSPGSSSASRTPAKRINRSSVAYCQRMNMSSEAWSR